MPRPLTAHPAIRWPVLAILATLWSLMRLVAAPSFEADIRPILKTHCFPCHGEGDEAPKAGLDLRQRRRIVGVITDDGPVLTPGDPSKSRMLANVRSGRMPKSDRKLAPVSGSAWRADEITMEDKAAGTSTVLTIRTREHGKGLKEDMFTTASLEAGHDF